MIADRELNWLVQMFTSSQVMYPDGEICWERFLFWIDRHRVVSHIGKHIQDGAILVPAKVEQAIRVKADANKIKSMLLVQRLVQLQDYLHCNSIDTIAVKGVALSQQIFGAFDCRHAGDLDLLVPPDQIWRADELLLESGYRRTGIETFNAHTKRIYQLVSHELGYIGGGNQPISIELLQSICSSHVTSDLFEDQYRAEVVIGGSKVNSLCINDHFLQLCIHGACHAWGRLHWLLDVQRMVSHHDLDWVYIEKRGRQLNCVSQIRIALELVSNLKLTSSPSFFGAEFSSRENQLCKLSLLVMTSETYGSNARPIVRRWMAICAFRLSKKGFVKKFIKKSFHGPFGFDRLKLGGRLAYLHFFISPLMYLAYTVYYRIFDRSGQRRLL